MSQDGERDGSAKGGMTIQQWEAFRIRAEALEQAVKWGSGWESGTITDVLDTAEELVLWLETGRRYEVRDLEEADNGPEP